MVRKIRSGLRDTANGFFVAFRLFSHNARAYLVSAFAQSLGAAMLATVFALYIKSAGMSEATIGYVEGAIGIGVAVVALLGGPLVSTLGYRILMLGALVMLVVSRFTMAFTPFSAALIGLGLVVGLGDGFLRTVNSAFLSENSGHEERSHLFSTEFLVRMIAVFTGGVLGGFLPGLIGGAEIAGYQWTIWVGTALMALGLVPMSFVREKVHGVRGFGRVYIDSVKGFSEWGHLGRLVAPQAMGAAAGGLTAPFIPLYLKHTLGATVQQVGLIQGFGALVVGVAAFATPALVKRLGLSKGIIVLHLAATPFLLLVPWVGTLSIGVILLFTRSTLMGIGGPLWNECSMTGLCGKDKPLVAGGLFFSLSVMGFVGNVVGGKLMEISYTAPYLPATALWVAGIGLTWLLWIRPARHAEKAAAAMGELAMDAA